MNGQRALAVAVLACSVVVLGTMAGSLEATISSSPDDAVDVDTDRLPFMGDGASEVADSYKQADEGTGQREVQSAGEDAADREGAATSPGAEQRSGGAGGEAQSAAGGQGDGPSEGGASNEQQSGTGEGGAEESPWTLLQKLLAAVLWIAAVLVALGALRLLYRHRHRLLARLRALARRYGLGASDRKERAPAGPTAVERGDSAVERAWAEMIRASGARPAPSATARECAGSAIDAGVDREAAHGLTALYERVQYGERSPTSDEAERARTLLESVAPAVVDRGRATGGPTSIGDPRPDGPGRADGGVPTDDQGGDP